MKTTLEIPDRIFRRAKARASEQGIPFRRFVSDAVAEKLAARNQGQKEALVRLTGKLRHLRQETAAINRRIEGEFENIEPEDLE